MTSHNRRDFGIAAVATLFLPVVAAAAEEAAAVCQCARAQPLRTGKTGNRSGLYLSCLSEQNNQPLAIIDTPLQG